MQPAQHQLAAIFAPRNNICGPAWLHKNLSVRLLEAIFGYLADILQVLADKMRPYKKSVYLVFLILFVL